MKITQKSVNALDKSEVGKIKWDDDLKGFGVRVNRDHSVSYIAYFRIQGKQRKKVIGRAGAIKAEEARRRAKVLMGAASDGNDVIGRKAAEDNAPTIADLGAKFKEEYIPHHLKSSTQNEYTRNVELYIVPKLGHLKVKDLSRSDVATFHGDLAHKPYQANRVLGVLSKMISQAEVWDMRGEKANPCMKIKRYKEVKRERFLSKQELVRLFDALEMEEKTTPMTAAAFRLLIFTGCRLGEIQFLRWREVDFERRELRLEDSKTGRKTVYLTDETIAILKSIPQLPDNPYVIHGTVPGQHLTDFQKPWRRIRKAAHLPDVRIHDLRHTFASIGASQNLGLPIIGKLLGHTQAQTTARYAHLGAAPVRNANAGITRELSKLMNGSPEMVGKQKETTTDTPPQTSPAKQLSLRGYKVSIQYCSWHSLA